MPTAEWLNKYESIKDKLACKTDLEAYFTEKMIGNREVDVLDIGAVHFPTGTIFACDPLVELEDTPPFIQTIPAGTYPVKICVVPSERYGDRYACVKVEVSGEKPVRYELGMTGQEDLDEEPGEGDYFGFGVDAGMGCVADIQTQAAFKIYWAKRLEEDPDIDPYNDLFCELLEENAKARPKYQGDYGDWLNWTVPDTDCNLPIFASGWGDGYYPVYFGYDAKGKICAVYLRFIDIEASYQEQDDAPTAEKMEEAYQKAEEERRARWAARKPYWAHVAPLPPQDKEKLEETVRSMKRRLHLPADADGKTIAARLDEYLRPYIGKGKYPWFRYEDLSDFALQLGYLYGEAFRLAYGWQWVEIGQGEDETSAGLISPNEHYSIFPFNQMYKVLTGQYENTIVSLFDWCRDLDEYENDTKYALVTVVDE